MDTHTAQIMIQKEASEQWQSGDNLDPKISKLKDEAKNRQDLL